MLLLHNKGFYIHIPSSLISSLNHKCGLPPSVGLENYLQAGNEHASHWFESLRFVLVQLFGKDTWCGVQHATCNMQQMQQSVFI